MTKIELIQFLADGYTIEEISKMKNINRKTLDNRISVLKKRLHCKTTTQLVAEYLRKELIS